MSVFETGTVLEEDVVLDGHQYRLLSNSVLRVGKDGGEHDWPRWRGRPFGIYVEARAQAVDLLLGNGRLGCQSFLTRFSCSGDEQQQHERMLGGGALLGFHWPDSLNGEMVQGYFSMGGKKQHQRQSFG